MKQELVSVMIPCYNGENYIEQVFRSFSSQTYKEQQIIFVNDGSTDETEAVAMRCGEKLKEEGIRFLYLCQEHNGQASAINKALPYVEGKYCMWFDVDDWMAKDHIEKKVGYLERHPDMDLVMCKGCLVDGENTGKIIGKLGYEKAVGTLFEDLLFEYRRCSNGLFMVRTEALFASLKGKKIYESPAGQNWQLLLPVSWRGNNGFLEDELFFYQVRPGSHSRSFYSSEDFIRRFDELEDLRLHIIEEDLDLPWEYKQTLKQCIDLLLLMQRIGRLGSGDMCRKKDYTKKLAEKCLHYFEIKGHLGGRRLFLWGACPAGDRMRELLERYSDYKIEGYIDSDRSKAGRKRNGLDVCAAEDICVQEMYILVPLMAHQDILQCLMDKGFGPGKDFLYPRYDLKRFITGGKYAGL